MIGVAVCAEMAVPVQIELLRPKKVFKSG